MAVSISDACRTLLETVRWACRTLLETVRCDTRDSPPPQPVTAGTVLDPVPLKSADAAALFPAAASAAAGVDKASGGRNQTVVWKKGDRSLMIFPARVSAKFGPGVVAVTIPVSCDQTGDVAVTVTFVVGDPARPAGLLAATEARPRGPAIIVNSWGENLIAFAWETMLELCGNIAGEAGRDVDGAPLVPIALTASPYGLTIVPMARHTFDRRRT